MYEGLRRSRVVIQHCSVWVSESQSCRRLLPVAAVVRVTLLYVMIRVKLYKLKWYLWSFVDPLLSYIMCLPACSGEIFLVTIPQDFLLRVSHLF